MSSEPKIGQLPVHEQLEHFTQVLSTNKSLTSVLSLAPQLGLSSWYLAAGSLSQTIWNHVSGFDPETGISDYDLVYYDASDLSWEGEDRVIQAGKALFAPLGVDVEIRNQARVHMWYEAKHGVKCKPHECLEDGIDSWISNSAMVGVRPRANGDTGEQQLNVYAPWGLADMFNLVVRPNTVLGTKEAYDKKTTRWRAIWPDLKIQPWPTPA